jgi:hypothetical protein
MELEGTHSTSSEETNLVEEDTTESSSGSDSGIRNVDPPYDNEEDYYLSVECTSSEEHNFAKEAADEKAWRRKNQEKWLEDTTESSSDSDASKIKGQDD